MKQSRDLPDKEPERLIRFAARNRVRLRVIEIVVFIAIVTLLAAIAVPIRVRRLPPDGRSRAARADIAVLCEALEIFKQDKGRYPSSLSELITGDMTYLKASRVPGDPWGNLYVYRFPGQHAKEGYYLISYGPDGVEGGGDDITSW
jgi:general secretion pathway protein G